MGIVQAAVQSMSEEVCKVRQSAHWTTATESLRAVDCARRGCPYHDKIAMHQISLMNCALSLDILCEDWESISTYDIEEQTQCPSAKTET